MRWSRRAALSVVYWVLGFGMGYFAARATQRFDLADHVSCGPGERMERVDGPRGDVTLSCVKTSAGAAQGVRR